MAIINRVFNGKLNLDTSDYRMPQADYSDALNITRDAQGEGQDLVVTNVLGNQKVSFTLPSGTNKRMGSFPDPVRNRIYYFIWNSNGYNLWLYYDKTNDTIVKILEDLTDTGNVPVLDFNPSKRINHIDIIYRDNEGDLQFWTDGNTTPKCANVQTILDGTYGTVKASFIELAKMPPLAPPTAVYGNDTTKTGNALRRKLFQPSYFWGYDDFQKSTFSPSGKVPLPVGLYGSDNDLDNSNNNFITITVETGDKNVSDIYIAVRSNIGDAWGDYVLVASLNKSQLNIPDNSTYQFLFYNDALYPPIDPIQAIQLFDWCPQLCDALVLANGSIPVAGAITEGYNNYPVNDLQVTMTVENVKNSPPDSDPLQITYTQIGTSFTFTVTGTVITGTNIKIYIFFNGNPGIGQTYGVRLVAEYTTLGGDTIDDVASALYTAFGSFSSTPSIVLGSLVANVFSVTFGTSGNYVQQIVIVPGSTAGTISTEKTWLWDAQYIFGQVYEDEQNRDMPGVTTFSDPTNSDNDFVVNTPSFEEDGGVPKTPVISASVNHIPPTGAKKFNWVRRRQTFGTFLFYMTCDFQDDPDGDGYLYFCLANIEAYKLANNQFIYGTAPISPESRIKIVAGVTASAYNGDIWAQDYQILGTVTRTLTGGSSPDDDRLFIKVTKPVDAISPAYTDNMVVMVYTPSANPSSLADSVYYEWGENYEIYTGYTIDYSGLSGTFQVGETVTGNTSGATVEVVALASGKLGVENLSGTFQANETITGGTSGATATLTSISSGVLYHKGSEQDQTSFQPALYTFEEGDVYYRNRVMFNSIIGAPPYTNSDTVSIMDANYSDFFDSAVNDNGRPHAIEVNARNQFNPVMVRFAEAYQSGTNVNGVNRFYFENFDEYDRRFGSIKKLFIDKRYMDVYQEFDVGVVPVLTQVVRDTAGNPLEANSEILLNKIMYPYNGQFGIGDVPESFAYGKSGKYFIDSNKGIVCRVSQNGITPISVLYECNAFFVAKLAAYQNNLNNGNPPSGGVYTGNPTCYGIFDSYTNKYIIAMEEINRYNSQGYLTFHQDANTISFLETRGTQEGFESPYSYHPEGMASLNNLLVSFKDGEFWKHNSTVYCNFYGIQYSAYIEAVFNDATLEKKSWESLTQVTDTIWECPVMYTNVNTYAGQRQETVLIPQRFKKLEENPSAAIMRDIHSRGGLINGDFMKGNFLVVRFQKSNANELVILSAVSVMFKDSPLTNR